MLNNLTNDDPMLDLTNSATGLNSSGNTPSSVVSGGDTPVTYNSTNNVPSIPSETQLMDFLGYLENYQPTVPDSVTTHYMNKAGLNATDPRVSRLISIASQKFIADIANDALQHCKMRTALNTNKKNIKDKRYILTHEDLDPVLAEYGISVKKPAYYF